MHDVINHLLKQGLNHEIKNYCLALNEIQTRLSLPHMKTVSIKFGFFQKKNKLKYCKPEFVCPIYFKRWPY